MCRPKINKNMAARFEKWCHRLSVELDKKTYGQLLGRALPHVIHTEGECERLTNELMHFDEFIDSSP
jgi:hypothetical protein